MHLAGSCSPKLAEAVVLLLTTRKWPSDEGAPPIEEESKEAEVEETSEAPGTQMVASPAKDSTPGDSDDCSSESVPGQAVEEPTPEQLAQREAAAKKAKKLAERQALRATPEWKEAAAQLQKLEVDAENVAGLLSLRWARCTHTRLLTLPPLTFHTSSTLTPALLSPGPSPVRAVTPGACRC